MHSISCTVDHCTLDHCTVDHYTVYHCTVDHCTAHILLFNRSLYKYSILTENQYICRPVSVL